ncbi:MAG TPA: tetratricopeptide repeat protein [Acidiphilium sp.]
MHGKSNIRYAIHCSIAVAALVLPVTAAQAQGFTDAEKQLLVQCSNQTQSPQQSVDACNALLADPHVQTMYTQIGKEVLEGANFNLGIAYDRMDRPDEAIKSYDAALMLNPQDVQALGNRGADRIEVHDYKKAIVDLTQAIALDQKEPILFVDRGVAYQKTAQYQNALQDDDRAIGLAPNDPIPYFNRGNVLSALGQFDRAIGDYSKAIALKPDYAEAFENRATAYDKTGQHDLAAKDRATLQNLTAGQ